MPLTFTQMRERYIVNSIKDYLNTKLVTPYNAAVAGGPTPAPLGIELAAPEDPTATPKLPLIVMGMPTTSRPSMATGNGDGTVWLYKVMRLKVFPALNADNKADPGAAELLRTYLDYVLGTGLYIPLYDYSVGPPAVVAEAAEILEARISEPLGRPEFILDIEKYRFDFILSFRYTTVAING